VKSIVSARDLIPFTIKARYSLYVLKVPLNLNQAIPFTISQPVSVRPN